MELGPLVGSVLLLRKVGVKHNSPSVKTLNFLKVSFLYGNSYFVVHRGIESAGTEIPHSGLELEGPEAPKDGGHSRGELLPPAGLNRKLVSF